MKVKIYVIDDHPLVLEAMQSRFSAMDAIDFVGCAQSVQVGEAEIRLLLPDVIILDLRVEGMQGVSTLRELFPYCRGVVLFTSRQRDAVVEGLLTAGAHQYVGKSAELSELDIAIGEAALLKFGESGSRAPSASMDMPHDRLSPREHEVYRLLVDCRSPKEIAFELGVAPSTAYGHVERVVEKLGLSSPGEVLRYAMEFDVTVG